MLLAVNILLSSVDGYTKINVILSNNFYIILVSYN